MIRKRHHRSVLTVDMFLDRFDPDAVLDPLSSFRAQGITGGSCEIVYDVTFPSDDNSL